MNKPVEFVVGLLDENKLPEPCVDEFPNSEVFGTVDAVFVVLLENRLLVCDGVFPKSDPPLFDLLPNKPPLCCVFNPFDWNVLFVVALGLFPNEIPVAVCCPPEFPNSLPAPLFCWAFDPGPENNDVLGVDAAALLGWNREFVCGVFWEALLFPKRFNPGLLLLF